jgi:hypothetical protein
MKYSPEQKTLFAVEREGYCRRCGRRLVSLLARVAGYGARCLMLTVAGREERKAARRNDGEGGDDDDG